MFLIQKEDTTHSKRMAFFNKSMDAFNRRIDYLHKIRDREFELIEVQRQKRELLLEIELKNITEKYNKEKERKISLINDIFLENINKPTLFDEILKRNYK